MESASLAASTSSQVDVPSRKALTDLAPELRIQIYRFLFNGQIVKVNRKYEWEQRDRKLGLNILFTSKLCLAEAKPILLAMAVFQLRMFNLLSTRLRPEAGGLTLSHMTSVRSIITDATPSRRDD
ncbi:hypothetical protein H2200_010226 [Cladophialophora chaetospira]|uniref:Uncharacterized protein n=1 Tax=Cladophialophora chaetospira TaxID=386627 RepID=A0AA39CET7_9EURO|nr:hypothetical protein H2200_010226 [Cladophialophora chaetospira]